MYSTVKPKDRNNIKREFVTEIFSEPNLSKYHYKGIKHFKVGLDVDGTRLVDGQVPVYIRVAEDMDAFSAKVSEIRTESRSPDNKYCIYWVFSLTSDIDNLIMNLHASHQIMIKYDNLRAQNKISRDEVTCLSMERSQAPRLKSRLLDKFKRAMTSGCGVFRGFSKDASDLGKNLPEIMKKLFDWAVPDIYPKLEMGARDLKGTEAEEVLKSTNLKGLPQIFYESREGGGLIVKEGSKFVPNPSADIAQEIFNYITKMSGYGETLTGKTLESHFGGFEYGWDRDMLRLVLAVLMRAGSIEVTYKGRRFDDHSEPEALYPFTNNVAFKAASFSPHKAIELKTLTVAVKHYQELTGVDIDVDSPVIAKHLRDFASDEKMKLLEDIATANAEKLLVLKILEEYKELLERILNSNRDDCVKILAEEGRTLKEKRDVVNKIRDSITEKNITLLRRSRTVVGRIWPELQTRGEHMELSEDAKTLKDLINAPNIYEKLKEMARLAETIGNAYQEVYRQCHEERSIAYAKAIEQIKGRSEYAQFDEDSQKSILSQLAKRSCEKADLLEGELHCRKCHAGLNQLSSDIAAVSKLRGDAIARMQELVAPQQRVERVRIAEFFTTSLSSEEAVEEAMERLKDHLLKLIAEGATIILE